MKSAPQVAIPRPEDKLRCQRRKEMKKEAADKGFPPIKNNMMTNFSQSAKKAAPSTAKEADNSQTANATRARKHKHAYWEKAHPLDLFTGWVYTFYSQN